MIHITLGINVKILRTVGTPNTNGSLILNKEDGIANLPKERNLLFLHIKFILNKMAK